jgi:hypothetical protein
MQLHVICLLSRPSATLKLYGTCPSDMDIQPYTALYSSIQGAAAPTKKDPMLISYVNSSQNLNMNILYFKNYLVESYGQIPEHF